ncbi:MAG: hypothetical protein IJV15_02315 [Lachnospiraceae bacterium]|nr:hypothetical protein [Lachnospiraceae bacterium]
MKLSDRIRKSKLYKDNRGSAMIVAIVVSIVVIAFTLSLLLVAYSLFSSNTKKVTQTQVKELAKSVSIEIENELTQPHFDSKEELLSEINNPKHYLWLYLRYNIVQLNWPYYDVSTAGHTEVYAYRYFDINVAGGDMTKYATMADEITVCMYWSDDDLSEKDETMLAVEVSVKKDTQSCIYTTYYDLSLADYDDVPVANSTLNDVFNPNGNAIDISENWVWTKVN